MSPMRRARPAMLPTTIPAMAPRESPLLGSPFVSAAAVSEAEGVGVSVANEIDVVMTGRTTPAHLDSAPEL